MKQTITTILSVLFVFTTCAQTEIKKEYYDYAKKDLKSETPYKDGKIDGVQKIYEEWGDLQMEIPFSNGKINGIKKEYFGYGKRKIVKVETPYIDGKINGIKKEYYYDKKKELIMSETSYINDVKDGIEKTYAPGGSLISETNWVKGSKIPEAGSIEKPVEITTASKGTWVQQYTKKLLYVNYTTQNVTDENGKLVDRTTRGTKEFTVLEYEGEIVNGVREGKGTLYSYLSTMEDDIVMYVGEFKNGLPNGQGYLRPKFSKKLTGNPDKERYQIGFWKDGFYTGPTANWVTKTYDNGDTYEGQMDNGKLNGNGKYTWKNKNFVIIQNDGSKTYVEYYSGGWKDNNLHGNGSCSYGDSTHYDGDFVNGKREGKGTLIKSYAYWKGKNLKVKNLKVKTETIYRGEWKDDKFIKAVEY